MLNLKWGQTRVGPPWLRLWCTSAKYLPRLFWQLTGLFTSQVSPDLIWDKKDRGQKLEKVFAKVQIWNFSFQSIKNAKKFLWKKEKENIQLTKAKRVRSKPRLPNESLQTLMTLLYKMDLRALTLAGLAGNQPVLSLYKLYITSTTDYI